MASPSKALSKDPMNVNDARRFVQSVPLPAPTRGPRLEGVEAPVQFGSDKEAVAVGAQVTEFTRRVTPTQRTAVADCLLLAQLAANKATAQNPDQMAWYRKYVEVLENIGWTVDSLSLEDKQIEHVDLDVHKAIIPVLAELLGPAVAAVSLVIGVLKGLQEMDRDKPWITVFERASQHASGAKFQFGFVDATGDENPSVAIKVLAVAIDGSAQSRRCCSSSSRIKTPSCVQATPVLRSWQAGWTASKGRSQIASCRSSRTTSARSISDRLSVLGGRCPLRALCRGSENALHPDAFVRRVGTGLAVELRHANLATAVVQSNHLPL